MALPRSRRPSSSDGCSEYDEEDVETFTHIIDDRDFERIKSGLDQAAEALRSLPPEGRRQSALAKSCRRGIFALFEALTNEKFLARKDLVENHFDETFDLVQTMKPLIVAHYVPAMTMFAFDRNDKRFHWAKESWRKIAETPRRSGFLSEEDFDFAVRRPLCHEFDVVLMAMPDSDGVNRFWRALKMIIEQLTPDLITHGLRSMDQDLYRIALDHLQIDSHGLIPILQSVRTLLTRGPKDFWDAMGAIAPTTVIEQIFNSPYFDKFIASVSTTNCAARLEDVLGWIKPFMASLSTSHKPRACRSLAFQLLKRLQADRFPSLGRTHCYSVGMGILFQTLHDCNEKTFAFDAVGRVVAIDTLAVFREYLDDIMAKTFRNNESSIGSPLHAACVDALAEAIELECHLLRSDRDKIHSEPKLPAGFSTYVPVFWESLHENFNFGGAELARIALAGMYELVGLEGFESKQTLPRPTEQTEFNSILKKLGQTCCSILERVGDSSPQRLSSLASGPVLLRNFLSPLFSSDQEVSESGASVLKSASEAYVRRDALSYFLNAQLAETLDGVSWAIMEISKSKVFGPCPRTLKICADVMDVLCDSQDGILGTISLTVEAKKSARAFWAGLWDFLHTTYKYTQQWADHVKVAVMKEFCRDVMQFSDRVVREFSIFDSATSRQSWMDSGNENKRARAPQDEEGGALLLDPSKTLTAMIGYLKLRDEYLLSTSVDLIQSLVTQLSSKKMVLAPDATRELERLTVAKSKHTNMTGQQKAEILKVLEENIGRPAGPQEKVQETGGKVEQDAKASLKQGAINIGDWSKKAKTTTDIYEDIASITPAARMLKEQQRPRPSAPDHKSALSMLTKEKKPLPPPALDKRKEAETQAFLKSREQAKREKQRRDAEAVAKQKKHLQPNTMAGQTAGEGSALEGIGNLGKDHRPRGTGMWVSSDSEEDSDEELDRELFGSPEKKKQSGAVKDYKASKAQQLKAQMPVKKQRQVRTTKDMLARVAPDLSPLHKSILGWDFFHESDFPPGSSRPDYKVVAEEFRTAAEYRSTFEPLLLLEAWQGLRQAREEGNARPFKLETKSRMTSDHSLVEIGASMDPALLKELKLSEADILLISKDFSKRAEAGLPNCLARIKKITRQAAKVEITIRVAHGTPMIDSLGINVTVRAEKITSMIPLEREYGGLCGLEYYDLCDEIIRATPSPLLKYSEQTISRVSQNYELNAAQSKAVQSAVDNDSFTLIQGPPGSGKTKTIVAIVGALLTGALRTAGAVPIAIPGQRSAGVQYNQEPAPRKLLVCAPSNAAVDELVMRVMQGVKTLNGNSQKISVLRLGRSESINPKVMEVTLDELVNKRLNLASEKSAGDNDITKVMQEHKSICEQLNALRAHLDEGDAKGAPASAEQKHELEVLKRKKSQLSSQIDRMKDSGNTRARDSDIRRNHVRQEIINGAHVICATLSGSGHDMFRTLKIDFETVVIDEAAQSVELSALIPLKYGCSKCIMVGDPKQLPPTVFSREASRFQYEQSLFVRMQNNSPQDVHLLDTQYRMHPEISYFPSQAFYDGRLLDGPGMATARARPWHKDELLGPYRFFDVQGMHQSAPKGHSLVNVTEVDIALQLFRRLVFSNKSEFDLSGKVGIITPYKSQIALLRDRFRNEFGESIKDIIDFSTTDAFQGRESEVIIFSCVRSSLRGIGFLSDIRRMNVGITRAKSSLWVIGNSESLKQGEYWGKMIADFSKRDLFTAETAKALQQKSASSTNVTAPPGMPRPPSGPRMQPSGSRAPSSDPRLAPTGPKRRPPDSVSSNVPVARAPPNGKPDNNVSASRLSRRVDAGLSPSSDVDTTHLDVTSLASDPMDLDSVAPATRPDQITPPRILPGNPVAEDRSETMKTQGLTSHASNGLEKTDGGREQSRKREPTGVSEPDAKRSRSSTPAAAGSHQQGYRVSKPPVMPKKAQDSIFIKPKARRR